MEHILVIDVGTSSMRGVLFDESGRAVHVIQRQYQTLYMSSVLVEEEPAVWRATLMAIAKEQAAYIRENGLSLCAMALTAQRSTVMAVDRDGRPLRNAIMWMDKRNGSICEALKEEEAQVFQKTGARLNTVFSGTKMTWIRQNEPDVYRRAYKLLTLADYLAFLMTGNFRTDHTYGSRSLLMNIHTRQWDGDMLSLLEVEEGKLCTLIPPGDIHGHITASFSEKTGLPAGIPLISAGGDQQCAALGMGVIGSGDMEITTGTGAFLLAASNRVPEALQADILCGAHAIPDHYALEASMLACSSIYDWFCNQFYQEFPKKRRIPAVNEEIMGSPPGAKGVLALPYFQGRGTPDWNSSARGAFLGLTPNATRGDMARALLESIAMEASNSLALMQSYIGQAGNLYINGGLTKFDAFNRIQANAYGRAVCKSSNPEQTSLGAWSSAAVAMGLYRDHGSALTVAKQADPMIVYQPEPETVALYEEKRREMNAIYSRLYQSGS